MARDARDGEHGVWFRRFHADAGAEADCELVCFPHAGGSAATWRTLSAALAGDADVLAVQYPGRHDRYREPPVADLHVLADGVADALRRSGGRPRVLLGHSMGASLAYEVAVRLADEPGRGPHSLVLTARRAPSVPEPSWDWIEDDAALVARLRALGGTEAAALADPELLEMVLPALRGDYRALAAYRPTQGRPLACPVLACAGDRDAEAPVAEVEAWREHTAGGFELRVFEGGHFFLHERVEEVADLVRGRLPVGSH
ncbi:alpha/beta fold hydrolase [Streptomyces sp. TRM70308]|uniref:thioesterase II family protein n=1 Tax=Streptomyces sp. TRM70308 TaxID=3131932 RepID=UPI003D06B637